MSSLQSRLRELPTGFWAVCIGVFFLGFGMRLLLDAAPTAMTASPDGSDDVATRALALVREGRPMPRTAAAYDGLGVWVDAFDFSPSYTSPGRDPALSPDVVDEFAELGVRTVYLQAARADERAPGDLLEPELLAEWLARAHARGIAVVGWYLPTFVDVDADLRRLLAVATFDAGGHRFDGVGVDIEYIEGVPDDAERSARLVELSARLAEARPNDALGAIVPPAVQLEVVNPAYWPDFPWREIQPLYDVWQPMAYWTTRSNDSGFRDAYAYTEESTRRMRANLGDPDALVHPIGGIGDATTSEDLAGFRRALLDTDSVGGSIYDWNSMSPSLRSAMDRLMPG